MLKTFSVVFMLIAGYLITDSFFVHNHQLESSKSKTVLAKRTDTADLTLLIEESEDETQLASHKRGLISTLTILASSPSVLDKSKVQISYHLSSSHRRSFLVLQQLRL